MSILKSLFITSIISLLFGFGLHKIVGFWEGFALSFALQLVVSFVYSSWKITQEQDLLDKVQQDIDNLLDMSMVTIECPCGKNKFEDTVFVGIENIYTCDSCGNKFKTDITITPTLLTEPVDIKKTNDNVNKTFEDLVKEKEL